MHKNNCHCEHTGRRALLKTALGVAALGSLGSGLLLAGSAEAAALTREERDSMTPDQVIEGMKQGNTRFRSGKTDTHDYLAQKRASAAGQYPSAVILSCIDSRAPAEIILDAGIGETFNARIAGNISNADLLGSMEFACAVAGAKVILVMGHTACGAVRGAIDQVKLGHLTGLLEQIRPAVEATVYQGERSGNNGEFVDAVARSNVLHTIEEIRKNSPILAELEQKGSIKIAGAMYTLDNGVVEFMA